jgi:hypothetical protein
MPTLAQLYLLTGFKYRRKITVTAGSNGMPSNYQLKITLDTASLISAGKMRGDCGDILFTKADKLTPLSYWIESGINTSNTIIWVNDPDSLLANASHTIYMYYGNPNITSQSNGNATFIFFDDFSIKDTSKWNWPSDWTVETGYAKQTYSSGWPPSGQLAHIFSPSCSISSLVGIAIETYVKNLGTASAYDLRIAVTDGGTRYETGWAVGAYDFIFNSGLTNWNEPDTRNWSRVSLTVRNGEQRIWINNVSYASNTVSITSVSKIDINSKGQSYWDWIAVRQYVSPEPTLSIGNEEYILRYPDTI